MNINLSDQAINTAMEHLGGTWDRLVNPSAEAVGNFFGDLFEVVGLPLHYAKNKLGSFYDNKLDIYKQELTEKALSIPEDKKTMPNPSNLMMMLDSSRFSFTNDELRKMFVNLIASSMNSDTSSLSHPSFSDIIKQMDSLDAMIINNFSQQHGQPTLSIIYNISTNNGTAAKFNIINDRFYWFNASSDQDKTDISISNLIRLGLLIVDINHYIIDNDYSIIKEHADAYIEQLIKNGFFVVFDNFQKSNISYEQHYIKLTDLGCSFVKVCCA